MSDVRPFAHLHCHTHFSLLDGATRIADSDRDCLVKKVKASGMNAVAITDHGNLYGSFEFYNACKGAGINPIIGLEAYVAPGSRFDKKGATRVKEASFHLTLLAMNLTYAEQRALEIGITIAGGASVILLDEPTAGMSKSETRRFVQLIREVTQGRTLLTVEHDMGVVFGLADKIAVLVYGEVIAFDTPSGVRANPRVQEAYLGSVLAHAQAAEAGH